jgi:hypothetical protein
LRFAGAVRERIAPVVVAAIARSRNPDGGVSVGSRGGQEPSMRHTSPSAVLGATLMLLAAASTGIAAAQESGALEQTIPPAVSSKLPPLHLSDEQRGRIRAVLRDVNSEVDFALKSNKPAKDFSPSVGARIPAGLHPHSLPPPLIYEMPVLRDYTYLKFKHQVLIVDAMTRKIVDMFAEASG